MPGKKEKELGEESSLSQVPEPFPISAEPRKARLWDLMRQTFNHDFPNMLVALQGLLQMLKLEQEENLNSEGQDYLRRLLALSQKFQNSCGIIKSLNKVVTTVPPAELVELSELTREVAVACQKLFPSNSLVFHTFLKIPQVIIPRTLMQQMMIEMVRMLAVSAPEQGDIHCCVATQSQNGKAEIFLGNWEGGPAKPAKKEETEFPTSLSPFTYPGDIPSEGKLDSNFFCPENYLNMVLIEEMALSCRCQLITLSIPNLGKGFLLTIPSRDRSNE